jgi:hypothetical protein
MNAKNEKLINKADIQNFTYRLIQVSYVLITIITSFFIIFFAWTDRPVQIVDLDNTIYSCEGRNFSLRDAGITRRMTIYESFYDFEKELMITLCNNQAIENARNSYNQGVYVEPNSYRIQDQNYFFNNIEFAYSESDSLFSHVILVAVSFIIINLILLSIRKELLYLFLGTPFFTKPKTIIQ